MRIKLLSKITNATFQEDIWNLLVMCDHEFVPPLSSRGSTTQADLDVTEMENAIPKEYFKNILSQNNLVAIEDGHVVAFMSFKKNYVCENIASEYAPNLYVTTIIVHPEFRHQGIAGKFYRSLMRTFKKHYIFTRTWSSNKGHLRILTQLGFHGHCYLADDRGPGIDTVYYRYEPKCNTLNDYIKQYHLTGNIIFSVLLMVITAICIVVWTSANEDWLRELMLAIATSLMASFLCLVSDTFIKIRESQNDEFISKFKDFGIENLHFNKSEVLEKIIPTCREEIWISGYRLIMTSKPPFRNSLTVAARRSKNLKIRILAVPPWTDTYKKTYGEEDTSVNYLLVLSDLCECVKKQGLILEVRFTSHPLFNDTYKVDDRFITGPYLNCTDNYKNRITAKDFFTLDVVSGNKELYKLINDDYMTVWEEAEWEMDIPTLTTLLEGKSNFHKLTKEERFALLQSVVKNR